MNKLAVYNLYYNLGVKYAQESIESGEDLMGALSLLTDTKEDSNSEHEGPDTRVPDTNGERPSSATWGDKIELFTEGNTGVNVR